MGLATVTRNYQITLPRDVREFEDIHVGDKLIVLAQEGEIVIRKMKREILEKAFGAWKSRGSGADFVRKLRDESDRARRLGI